MARTQIAGRDAWEQWIPSRTKNFFEPPITFRIEAPLKLWEGKREILNTLFLVRIGEEHLLPRYAQTHLTATEESGIIGKTRYSFVFWSMSGDRERLSNKVLGSEYLPPAIQLSLAVPENCHVDSENVLRCEAFTGLPTSFCNQSNVSKLIPGESLWQHEEIGTRFPRADLDQRESPCPKRCSYGTKQRTW